MEFSTAAVAEKLLLVPQLTQALPQPLLGDLLGTDPVDARTIDSPRPTWKFLIRDPWSPCVKAS
jgi:hypothetical protein